MHVGDQVSKLGSEGGHRLGSLMHVSFPRHKTGYVAGQLAPRLRYDKPLTAPVSSHELMISEPDKPITAVTCMPAAPRPTRLPSYRMEAPVSCASIVQVNPYHHSGFHPNYTSMPRWATIQAASRHKTRRFSTSRTSATSCTSTRSASPCSPTARPR